MSYKALGVSILMAMCWTAAALWAVRPAAVAPKHKPRIFVVTGTTEDYQIHADEARNEGFCTVFILDGERIAGVCGQHTWSQAEEQEGGRVR